MTTKPKNNDDAMEALEEIEYDMKASAHNEYPSAEQYQSQRIKLNNEIEWIEAKVKTIRNRLEQCAEYEKRIEG